MTDTAHHYCSVMQPAAETAQAIPNSLFKTREAVRSEVESSTVLFMVEFAKVR